MKDFAHQVHQVSKMSFSRVQNVPANRLRQLNVSYFSFYSFGVDINAIHAITEVIQSHLPTCSSQASISSLAQLVSSISQQSQRKSVRSFRVRHRNELTVITWKTAVQEPSNDVILLPCSCTAFVQAFTVNLFWWRIRDERPGIGHTFRFGPRDSKTIGRGEIYRTQELDKSRH